MSKGSRWCSPQVMLLLTFAAFYFAIGPGNFFSSEEVEVEETAQAVIVRHTVDLPLMTDARLGRAQSYYGRRGPGLPFASLPFVYAGLKLDHLFGSMNGGELAGPPIGTEEQPLRWGGRLAVSTTLIMNALVGGAIVAMLFMVGVRLTGNRRASMLMACAAGLATTVMSDATHFLQHPMSALMLIVGFWFFARDELERIEWRGLLGGLSLGAAILARPDAAAAAVILWLYGAAVAWKLMRDFPDRWWRMIRRGVLAGIGPAASVAGYLYYNHLKFGGITQFGYDRSWEHFGVDPAQNAQVIMAYLISPALSIFLFAPPLMLAVAAGRRAFRRWPLAASALLSAGVSHLLLISCFGSGGTGYNQLTTLINDVTYGPRFMLEEMVLLMPLTLPAFEAVADWRSRRAAIMVAAVVFLGFVVQLSGASVYLAVNEWHRAAASAAARAAYPFVLSESPIVIHLQELWAGRNLSPWLIRAWAHPGPALVLWVCLVVVVLAGGRWLIGYFRAPTAESRAISSDRLPIAIVLAAALPILVGFTMVRPITDAPAIRASNFIKAGLAAQESGGSIAASEDYAMALSLDPSNKFALCDLGILQQDAGRLYEAFTLYIAVLRIDPDFKPARDRLVRMARAPLPK